MRRTCESTDAECDVATLPFHQSSHRDQFRPHSRNVASQLNLKVVAEGVELEDQLDSLRRHNCEQIQGFLFSKPLAAKEFEALVLAHSDRCEKAAGLQQLTWLLLPTLSRRKQTFVNCPRVF